ncbi:hypothetical protein SFUMM280S_07422 [Streptomyces fumanus]
MGGGQGLGEADGLGVHPERAERVGAALRGGSVRQRGGGEQEAGAVPVGGGQRGAGTGARGVQQFQRPVRPGHRAGAGPGEVQHQVVRAVAGADRAGFGDVALQEAEAGAAREVGDLLGPAGGEVVQAVDFDS